MGKSIVNLSYSATRWCIYTLEMEALSGVPWNICTVTTRERTAIVLHTPVFSVELTQILSSLPLDLRLPWTASQIQGG